MTDDDAPKRRARHGTGTILDEPGRRTLRIQYCVRGKVIRENTGLPPSKRAAAERLLRTRLAAADRGEFVAPELRKTTWEHLAALVVQNYRANKRRSTDAIERRLKNVSAAFGGQLASRITTERIEQYVATRLQEGAANASVNRELAAIRRAFRLGWRLHLVGYVPPVTMLEEAPARAGFFEAEQLESVLGHLPEDLHPLVRTYYITGWRRDELLTRRWHHVDFRGGWLRLDGAETKTGKARQSPFTDELRQILEAQRDRTRELERAQHRIISWVFHREGKPVRSIYGAWRAACTAAGLPGKLVHDFRRTAVRNLERAGVPRAAAMAMVGHQTEAMYRRYSIQDEATLQEAARKLERLK